MPMKLRDIHEGKAYIKDDWKVRLVYKIFKGQIYYGAFTLPAGKYEGLLDCQTAGFTNWADREATLDEFELLDREAMQQSREKQTYHILQLLSSINDYDLYTAARWRGVIKED